MSYRQTFFNIDQQFIQKLGIDSLVGSVHTAPVRYRHPEFKSLLKRRTFPDPAPSLSHFVSCQFGSVLS